MLLWVGLLWALKFISQVFLPFHSSFTSTCISNTISDLLAFKHTLSFLWWQVLSLSNSFLLSQLKYYFSCIPDSALGKVFDAKTEVYTVLHQSNHVRILWLFAFWLPTRLYTWRQEGIFFFVILYLTHDIL